MFQNHLLELLCLVAMDEPKDSSSESIRNQKINVLNKIRKINFKLGLSLVFQVHKFS